MVCWGQRKTDPLNSTKKGEPREKRDVSKIMIVATTSGIKRTSWARRLAIALLLSLLVFVLSGFVALRVFEKAVTFHPVGYNPETWQIPPAAEDVWFETGDGVRLNGWLFKTQFSTSTANVIFFHGNGGNITNVAWVGEALSRRGFNVLVFDYRGYGRSGGEVEDEQALYMDAAAAYDFITKTRGIKPETVVLYGQSLGTTMVVELASHNPCGALILESGPSSASELATEVLPWFPRQLHFLTRNRFESARTLSNVTRPVLITHGDPDPVIATRHARLLFAAAKEPKKLLIFPGAGHNVFGSVGDRYWDTLAEFIHNKLHAVTPK
jgi:fermentation-respiration switch protein FrsA (DUF1100 family)